MANHCIEIRNKENVYRDINSTTKLPGIHMKSEKNL